MYTFPNSQKAIDAGFNPVSNNPDGSVLAVLSPMYDLMNKQLSANFKNQTGLDFHSDPAMAHESITQSNVIMKQAGISEVQTPGMVPAGTNALGKLVYTDPNANKSQDITQGSKMVSTMQTILDPMGVLQDKDAGILQEIGVAASDAGLIMNLTQMQQNGDTKGFINTLLAKYRKPLINELGDLTTTEGTKGNKQTKQGLDIAMDTYQMYNNWKTMSDAQKGIAIATTGIKGYNLADGTNLFEKPIINPTYGEDGSVSVPGLTVGQGIGLLQSGVNVYSLAKNWDKYNTIQKVIGGGSTALDVAKTMQSLGLIGKGATNAAVATSAKELGAIGFNSTPAIGIGAGTISTSTAVPAGYSMIGMGKDIAGQGVQYIQPTANTASSVFGASANPSLLTESLGNTSGLTVGATDQGLGLAGQGATAGADTGSSLASNIETGSNILAGAASAYQMYQGIKSGDTGSAVAGGVGVASAAMGGGVGPGLLATGAVTTYKGWGEGGVKGRVQGAIGGTAMGVGAVATMAMVYGSLAAIGPVGWAAAAVLAVGSVVADSIKVGKSTAQGDRDLVRDQFHKTGLIDDQHMVTLADGTKYDVGVDGHGGYHETVDGGTAQAFDIDYKNKLDFAAGMGGSTLARLTAGGKDTGLDQVGNQLGNAALSTVGYKQELTQDNFNKVADNLRAMYAKSGITSKEAGYALANQAYGEGRLDEQDHLAALQTLNFLFDPDGYKSVTSLLGAQEKILDTANKSTPSGKPTVDVSTIGGKKIITKPAQVETPSQPSGTTNLPANISGMSTNTIMQGVAGIASGRPGKNMPAASAMVDSPYSSSTNAAQGVAARLTSSLKDAAPVTTKAQPYFDRRKLMNISKESARDSNARMFGGG